MQAVGLGSLAAVGEADSLGAAVVLVRHPLDVAPDDEVVDDLPHRLLGHVGPLGEFGQPQPVVSDETKDAAMGGAQVGELAFFELLAELGDHRLEGDVEQPGQRDPGSRFFGCSRHFVRETDKVAVLSGHLTRLPYKLYSMTRRPQMDSTSA